MSQIKNNNHGYGWSNQPTLIENGETQNQSQQQHFADVVGEASPQQVPLHQQSYQPHQLQQQQQQQQHQNYPSLQQSDFFHHHHNIINNNRFSSPITGTHPPQMTANNANNASNNTGSSSLRRFPDLPALQPPTPKPAQPQLQVQQPPPPIQRLHATTDNSIISGRPRMTLIPIATATTTTTTTNNNAAGSISQHQHPQQHHSVNPNTNHKQNHKTRDGDEGTDSVGNRQLQMENEMLKRRVQQLETELANTKRLLLKSEINNRRKRPRLPMASTATTNSALASPSENSETNHEDHHNHHHASLAFPYGGQIFMAGDGEDDNDTNSLSGLGLDNTTGGNSIASAIIDQRSPLRLRQNLLLSRELSAHSPQTPNSAASESKSPKYRNKHRGSDNDNRIPGFGAIVDGRKHRHNAMFANSCDLLREYKASHGHCNVPRRDGFLGEFVMKQRAQYKKYQKGEQTPMDAQRVAILEKIGLQWTSSYFDAWEIQYQRLKQVNEEYGHCCAKAITKLADDKKHQQLISWMTEQKIMLKRIRAWEKAHNRTMSDSDRKKMKNMTMTVERQNKLEGLKCMYILSSCDKDPATGSTNLSPEQVESETPQQQKSGDQFLPPSRTILNWFIFFEESREYIATHGTLDPPFHKSGLSAWIRAQRKSYKAYKDVEYSDGNKYVTKLRVQLLNSIGFPWVAPAKQTKSSIKPTTSSE